MRAAVRGVKARHLGNFPKWIAANCQMYRDAYPSIPPESLPDYIDKVYKPIEIFWTPRGYSTSDYCTPANPYFHVSSGQRRTVGNDVKNPLFTVRVMGDSRIQGLGCEDRDTLPSALQARFNEAGLPVRVVNDGIGANCLPQMINAIEDGFAHEVFFLLLCLPLRASSSADRLAYPKLVDALCNRLIERRIPAFVVELPDIRRLHRPGPRDAFLQHFDVRTKKWIALATRAPERKKTEGAFPLFLNTQFLFDDPGQNFFLDPAHFTPAAHAILGGYLFEEICRHYPLWKGELTLSFREKKPLVEDDPVMKRARENFDSLCRKGISVPQKLASQLEILKAQLKARLKNAAAVYEQYPKFMQQSDRTGCVVMNCNPFTRGHQYLVEQALKHVDFLYIFILSEERSSFLFKHRFQMVQESYRDDKRVLVLPGGDLILSAFTFPAYFGDKNNENVDPMLDIYIFCFIIAEIFNIKYRFVGTEPLSATTARYNQVLKDFLPFTGIKVVEMERKTLDAEPISASRVRQLMQEHRLDEIEELVPPVTLDIIRKFYTEERENKG